MFQYSIAAFHSCASETFLNSLESEFFNALYNYDNLPSPFPDDPRENILIPLSAFIVIAFMRAPLRHY
jgi:hypothetical protein